MSASVKIKDLSKSYGNERALAGINLEIQPGQILGLLGPNGAGKTTAVKIVATLLKPDAGRVTIMEHDVESEPDKARLRLGYVPQELIADKALTAPENLRFFCRLYHLKKADIKSRISELLTLVDLTEHTDRPVRTFSGGMRKRLDLACGLAHKPDVLILDEPSLGLDVRGRRRLWDHILKLSSSGMAMLLATNSMEECEVLCHKLAILDAGKVVASGSPTELKQGLGGDVISLSFDREHPMPSTLPGRLSQMSLVKRVIIDLHRVDLMVTSNENALPPILQAARSEGANVSQATYSRPSLEAVFLNATGRHFGELPT